MEVELRSNLGWFNVDSMLHCTWCGLGVVLCWPFNLFHSIVLFTLIYNIFKTMPFQHSRSVGPIWLKNYAYRKKYTESALSLLSNRHYLIWMMMMLLSLLAYSPSITDIRPNSLHNYPGTGNPWIHQSDEAFATWYTSSVMRMSDGYSAAEVVYMQSLHSIV